jgi:hypothetical protein
MTLLKREALKLYRQLKGEVFVEAESFTEKLNARMRLSALEAIRTLNSQHLQSRGVQTELKNVRSVLKLIATTKSGKLLDPFAKVTLDE